MEPKSFGRYEIRGEIGRGGMATVYRAYDPRFKREVALKTLPQQFLHDPQFRLRFEREAQTIATLEHPAILPVYDFGEDNGQLYLVTRFMSGGSLADQLDKGPITVDEAARIITRLAPGLDAAHNRGMIHRDLKPGNILFDEWDKPYLADFGIVKLVEGSSTALTMTGGLVGTPAYMSPEQVVAMEEIDGRSDIYAMGVILYEMLSGKIPYRSTTPMGQAFMHVNEAVPHILDANAQLPPLAQDIIERAMAKDRRQRYPTTQALAVAVTDLAAASRRPTIREAATPPPVKPRAERAAPPPPPVGRPRPVVAADQMSKTIIEPPPPPMTPPPVSAGEPPGRKPWGWIGAGVAVLAVAGLLCVAAIVGLSGVLGSGEEEPTRLALAGESAEDERPAATAASLTDENGTEIPAAAAEPDNDEAAASAATPTRPTATPRPPTPTPPPAILYQAITRDLTTLDPQLAEDNISFDFIENLFVNLTNYDPQTSAVLPEAATSWTISASGLVYTFNLRGDIPWVYHNPATGETTQVVDNDGRPRFVTAHDFVYSIRRLCDPRVENYYSSIIAPTIAGCSEVYFDDADSVRDADLAAVEVRADSDTRLIVELTDPAGYFLSMTAMHSMAAVPQWVIEDEDEGWIEAGTIVTNGRYLLAEWVHSVRLTAARNPLLPADLQGDGNIEQVVYNVVPDTATAYALWLNNELDISAIPSAELDRHIGDFAAETGVVSDLVTFYIAFRTTKAPFDDARVRRAFSAAFDRQAYIDAWRPLEALPALHFAPPGIFGAPPIDEVGLGFDPEFAREQLAAAGYPNCSGFPTVTLLGYSSTATLNWIEFAREQWVDNLGCSSSQIVLEQQSFSELLSATSANTTDSEAPHMWTLGWGPDYPDQNNWAGDVLWCESDNRMKRSCNSTDTLIVQAREESDQAERAQLYATIEERFFGASGEMPFFPIWHRTFNLAVHDWLTWQPTFYGGDYWYNWTLDAAAQAAAR